MDCPRCGHAGPGDARFCMACGERLPERAEAAAERREITVMFCDMVGATELSGRLDPEDLRDLVREYQATCVEAVERHGGHVAQYLGDGILVYFGFPTAHEDDPARSVHAALDLLAAVEAREDWGIDVDVQVRVGIHTGLVVVGTMGAGARSEQLAMGQTPNVAARLQAVAAPNGIALSAKTARLVEGLFTLEPVGEHALKGVARPMQVFRATASQGSGTRFEQSQARGLSLFRGRVAELATLEEALDSARQRRPALVSVRGEAGHGKTRLVHRFQQAHPALRWLRVQHAIDHENDSLWAIRQVIEAWLEIDPSAPPADQTFAIERTLASVGIRDVDAPAVLATLFDRPLPELEPLRLSPSALRERVFDLLVALILRWAAAEPVVLWFDDLHWCDPSTRALLDRIHAEATDQQLLLLATHRTELSLELPDTRVIDLGVLGADEARGLAADVLSSLELSPTLRDALVERSDGVPLYVEELARAVAAAAADGEHAPLETQVPTSIHGAVIARLDRLTHGKRVAQLGALLGARFERPLVDALAAPETAVGQGLDELVSIGLIEPAGPEAYRFCHALQVQAAYDTLLKRRRRELHQAAADVLTGTFADRGRAAPQGVARHLRLAEQHVDAVLWLRVAASDAVERSAHVEAVRYLDEATALLPRIPDPQVRNANEFELQMMRAPSLAVVDGYAADAVKASYTRALELCEELGELPKNRNDGNLLESRLQCARMFLGKSVETDPDAEAHKLFWVLWGFGAFYQSRAELEQALNIGWWLLDLADGDPALSLEGHFGAGSTHLFRGELDLALDHTTRGLACFASLQAASTTAPSGHHAEVLCAGYRALALQGLSRTEAATAQIDEGLRLAESIEHPYSVAYMVTLQSWLAQANGDQERARERAQTAIDLSREHGFQFFVFWATPVLCWAQAREDSNQAIAAARTLRTTLEHYRGAGFRAGTSYFWSLLADVLIQAGQAQEAFRYVDHALDFAELTGERYWLPALRRQYAALRLATGVQTDDDAPTMEITVH